MANDAEAFGRFLAIYSNAKEPLVQEAIDFANDYQNSSSEWGVAYAWYLLTRRRLAMGDVVKSLEYITRILHDEPNGQEDWHTIALGHALIVEEALAALKAGGGS